MRAFFRGLLFVIVALLAIPFCTGLVLHLGSFEYFLATIGGVLLLASIILLIRARLSQAIFLLAISVITIMSSKDMIHWNGYNLFYSSYYFGGMIFPMWLLVLMVVLIVVMAVRR